MRNILRRVRKLADEAAVLRVGDYEIDVATRTFRHAENAAVLASLSKREVEILAYLHVCRPQPATRADILRNVWGYSRSRKIETRTVDIHIAKLRRKIEPDPKSPQFIVTERGDGYRLAFGG